MESSSRPSSSSRPALPYPIVYWQTPVGLPANGKSMAEALLSILVAAGPSISPADGPVLRDADNARQGVVKLGELQFFDTLNETPRDKYSGSEK